MYRKKLNITFHFNYLNFKNRFFFLKTKTHIVITNKNCT